MLRYIIVTLLAFFSLFINGAQAQEVATAFRYPVTASGLSVGSTYIYSQAYRDPEINNATHDGADFDYGCGEPIYTVANGQVEQSDYLVSYDGNGKEIPNTGWGHLIRIRHTMPDGSERYSQYAHLEDRYVVENETVSYGQQIGIMGTTGHSTGCHLHFMIITVGNLRGCGYFPSSGGCMSSWSAEQYWSTFIDPIDFLDDRLGPSIPSEASAAIQAKADELWAIRPSGSGLSCGEYESSGLICEEPAGGNMHWYEGVTNSFIIENWHHGVWGDVALTYDPDTNSCHEAFVLRHGFWEEYQLYGPDAWGAPLGDELDSTREDEYSAYDPYCTGDLGYTEPEQCIEKFCGSSRTYTSVQRFDHATLCWNQETKEVECDPTWFNPACYMSVEATSSVTPTEDDLLVYNSTIYWVHNGSTHGVVSAEMFEACGFSWEDPYPVTEEVFNSLPQGDTVHDPVSCGAVVDGTLVNQNGTVYEYWEADASWHGYPSELVFNACQNDWSSIQEMSSSVFGTITTGDAAVLGQERRFQNRAVC